MHEAVSVERDFLVREYSSTLDYTEQVLAEGSKAAHDLSNLIQKVDNLAQGSTLGLTTHEPLLEHKVPCEMPSKTKRSATTHKVDTELYSIVVMPTYTQNQRKQQHMLPPQRPHMNRMRALMLQQMKQYRTCQGSM